jgi:hypothetical protein
MNADELIKYFDVPFSFRARPAPVLPRHRLAWGISLLVLFLHVSSRGGRSSLQRLHILNWAVRNEETQRGFLEYLEGHRSPTAILVRYEPSFNRAIDYAVGEGLVHLAPNGRVHVTEAGRTLATAIVGDDTVLASELSFLTKIGLRLTEAVATEISNGK